MLALPSKIIPVSGKKRKKFLKLLFIYVPLLRFFKLFWNVLFVFCLPDEQLILCGNGQSIL